MRSNQLSAIPDEMGALVGLHRLNLANNRLQHRLTDHMGLLSCLTELDISTNRIGYLPPSLGGLEARGMAKWQEEAEGQPIQSEPINI